MRFEFYKLAEEIKARANKKPVLYISNGGNWGDAVIKQGTFSFLEYFSVPFIEVRPKMPNQKITRESRKNEIELHVRLLKAKVTNQLILFAGSGAWCKHYSRDELFGQLVSSYSLKNVIVLPSTYEFSPKIKNVTLYRRDNFESKTNAPNSKFCHDMAFFLEHLNFTYSTNISTVSDGFLFRQDVETSGKIEVPENNRDISTLGNTNTPISGFIEEILQYEHIHTDRLHVSIVAAILHKKVSLYPNSYFKNEAIFKTSIQENYPNVALINT
jgi:exopolysaccharide biosynthesis predicted pyruvyltransferase EpsI